jgi:hypothetical protein
MDLRTEIDNIIKQRQIAQNKAEVEQAAFRERLDKLQLEQAAFRERLDKLQVEQAAFCKELKQLENRTI